MFRTRLMFGLINKVKAVRKVKAGKIRCVPARKMSRTPLPVKSVKRVLAYVAEESRVRNGRRTAPGYRSGR